MKIISVLGAAVMAMALSTTAFADRHDAPRHFDKHERQHSQPARPDRHYSQPMQPQHHQHRAPQHYRPAPPPKHYRVQRGYRLPHGYGAPPPHYYAHRLPHRHGHEWRRVGSDMVLVAITTGIIQEVLHNVLH